MSDFSVSRDALLGALVGLARALSTNPPTDTTASVLISALLALSDERDSSVLDARLSAVHEEKFRVSPSCASCPSPCGATDDYDVSLIASAPADVRAAKHLMLAALFALARAAQKAQDAVPLTPFIEGLFALADERDAAALMPLALSLGKALDAASKKQG